jgi:hydrogenase expression/formation protein HypC
MCLAIPGRISTVLERDGLRFGNVDFGGVSKEVCLMYVPELDVGDYVVVHAGFAISKLNETAALETLHNFHQLEEPD